MLNIYEDFKFRGLIKDFSNEEKIREMLKTPQVIYCGFDPSASSMHMGNFVMVMTLMRLQRAGHKIIAVVGGGTGMIGDPSGRSSERNLLDENTLRANTDAIHAQLGKYLDLDDPKKGEIINNYDWLGPMSLLTFLRDYGKMFTVNYMLAKDTVARRLEDGISFTEFSYMLLQSYDFLHLHQTKGVTMQIGGGDQWGNLTAGLELIRKVEGNEANCEAMTSMLLTDSEGKKFGKSVDGALFLDKKRLSPYKLYQYFLNVGDESAIKYLKVFTFFAEEEINAIEKEHAINPGLRYAQKTLASEIIRIVHGQKDLDRALAMSEALFSGDVKSLAQDEIEELFANMIVKVQSGTKLEDILIEVKAAKSKREAREFILGNSVTINGDKVSDPNLVFDFEKAMYHQYLIIRRGKKNYFVAALV
jgi:tyrosyl-tRNA synthetase